MNVKVNQHFLDYINDWSFYEYYILGGYGSSKSFNTAIKIILKVIQEERRVLVVRATYTTLKDSCFQDLVDVINFLGLDQYFQVLKSPLSIRCKINNSKILFRGLDDISKIKSIKDISIVWIEENEATEDQYKELKDRLRIKDVEPHILITSNPYSKNHWSYRRFFLD